MSKLMMLTDAKKAKVQYLWDWLFHTAPSGGNITGPMSTKLPKPRKTGSGQSLYNKIRNELEKSQNQHNIWRRSVGNLDRRNFICSLFYIIPPSNFAKQIYTNDSWVEKKVLSDGLLLAMNEGKVNLNREYCLNKSRTYVHYHYTAFTFSMHNCCKATKTSKKNWKHNEAQLSTHVRLMLFCGEKLWCNR